MSWMAVAVGGSAVLGAVMGNKASSTQAKSAQAGINAQSNATEVQKQMFDKQIELQEPFRQTGLTAQNKLMEYMALGGDKTSADYGKYTRDFGMSDFATDPGYQFRLNEGIKAMDRTAAARGGLISGNALRAGGRYGQDMASQEYQNAFNRYQINRQNQLNPVQSLASQGQTAAGQQAGYAGQYGSAAQTGASNTAELLAQQGNAKASGYVGAGNAFTSGLNSYLNYQQGQNWLNKTQPPAATVPTSQGWTGP